MKTFRQFSAEAEFAVENMMLEARGFKGIAKKRRKKKKEFLSPREKKIQKLKNRPLHWQGLE
jgi:hypothetical protein